MYIVQCTMYQQIVSPHANMDRRLYPQIVTHKKSNLIYFQTFVRDLNKDPSVHGIIVQMPLDSEQEVKTRFGNDLKKNNFSAKMIILKQSNDNSEQSMTSFQKLL